MSRFVRIIAVALTLGSGVLITACGGTPAPGPSAQQLQAEITSLAGADSTDSSTAVPTSGAAVVAKDPCQLLTKADVQPFFTVPVVNELPEVYNTATTKGCAFSAAGAIATTLSIKVVVGDDAQTMELLQKSDTQEVTFSGVGVTAQHPHGSTEFSAQEGTEASPMYCAVSTTGWKELAGKKDLADVTTIPDATATTIAQQYGTLCNKLFGSGDATPTMTVAAPVVSASAPYTGTVLATVSTIGAGFPLPAGVDCSGTNTTTDSEGTVTCDTTVADGPAVYQYYLTTLPAKGYTFHHEGESGSGAQIVANLLFSGNGLGGFSSVAITGKNLSIMLQKD